MSPKIVDPDKRERALQLLLEGKSARAVGVALDLDHKTIGTWRDEAGIEPKGGGRPAGTYSSPHRKAARRLRAKGWTLVRIGKKLGITDEAVRQLLLPTD